MSVGGVATGSLPAGGSSVPGIPAPDGLGAVAVVLAVAATAPPVVASKLATAKPAMAVSCRRLSSALDVLMSLPVLRAHGSTVWPLPAPAVRHWDQRR